MCFIRLHKDKIKELNVRVVEAKKEYGVALQKLHNQRVRRLQKKYEMNYTKHMHESRQRLKPQNLKVLNIFKINILD